MSLQNSQYFEGADAQELLKALSALKIDHPKDEEELCETYIRFTDIEANVANLITKWDVAKQLTKVSKLKVDHSNLDEWVNDLYTRISPKWLRKVIVGPEKAGSLVPSFGEKVDAKDRPIYWYYIRKGVSSVIYDETVSSGALTETQREKEIDVLVKELRLFNSGSRRREAFERILRHPIYHEDPDPREFIRKLAESVRWLRANHLSDELFIAYLVPAYQRHIDTYGETSSMGKLRSRMERFLSDENTEKSDLLEFLDEWMTDANTFMDDKVPTGSKTALVSVSGTRFSKSSSSSTKRISKAFASFFDETTGEYFLRMPRKSLVSLFEGKCIKCGLPWSKNHHCSPEAYVRKGSGRNCG